MTGLLTLNVKHCWMLTDVKFDDILAFGLLVPWAAANDITLHVVVTNVVNKSGGMKLLSTLLHKMLCIHSISVSVIFYQGWDPKPDEDGTTKEKSHEGIFDLDLDAGEFKDKVFSDLVTHGNNTFSDLACNHREKDCDFSVFILAPFPTNNAELWTFLTKKAQSCFIGLGYNSSEYGMKSEQLNALRNLTVMNNMSPHIYSSKIAGTDKNEEGGRFSQSDNEVWDALNHLCPFFGVLKGKAVEDSTRFIARQFMKANFQADTDEGCCFDDDTPFTEEAIFDTVMKLGQEDEDKDMVSQVMYRIKWFLDNPAGISKRVLAYLPRCLAQLDLEGFYGPASGGIMIEVTDAQHIALWLTLLKQGLVVLKDNTTRGYVEIKPLGANNGDVPLVKAPLGITLAETRAAVLYAARYYFDKKRGCGSLKNEKMAKKQK